MSQDSPEPPETKRSLALRLIAEDRLTDDTIAALVGVNRRQLTRWRKVPQFAAEVQAIRTAAQEAALSEAIAVKANRLHDYQELRRRLWGTIQARAESGAKAINGDEYGRKPAPGAEQGLMVRKITPTRTGYIEEWAVDTAVIAELRALDKQAAQEMGDWTDKRELSGPGGGPVRLDLESLTDAEFAALHDLRRRMAGEHPPGEV